MMKIKSVAGLTCYVKNLKKTVKFYETLGFETRKSEPNQQRFTRTGIGLTFLRPARTNGLNLRAAATLAAKARAYSCI